MGWGDFMTDKEIIIPRCDQGLGDSEVPGYNRSSNVYHKQRKNCLLERKTSAQAW